VNSRVFVEYSSQKCFVLDKMSFAIYRLGSAGLTRLCEAFVLGPPFIKTSSNICFVCRHKSLDQAALPLWAARFSICMCVSKVVMPMREAASRNLKNVMVQAHFQIINVYINGNSATSGQATASNQSPLPPR